jgi:hypothetical protein
MSGTLSADGNGVVVLDGDKIFSGQSGRLHQQINIRGKNNKIEGGLTIANDIVLNDSNSTVSIDLLSSVKGNVYLNGGSLYISDNNLRFDDKEKIVGPGKIYINGNKLIFGSKALTFDTPLYFVDAGDIQINDAVDLNSVWTFSGECMCEGSNNLLWLDVSSSKIIIESGSSVLFKNMVLHGVHTGNLLCMDNYSTITFQNVDIYFDSDFTFSQGHFDVLNSAKFIGNCKFIYNTIQPSTIASGATLVLDSGITFSYDPGNMRKDLIEFEDSSACLQLNGATLHATVTGLQLIKGCLEIEQNSYLESEKAGTFDEGITFGDGTVENDLHCTILKSSKLELLSGSLKYKNISASAWVMKNYMSELNVNAGCNLYLYQDLNLGQGTINYKGRGGLFNVPGKNLTGTFNVVGYMDYRLIN